MAYRDMNSEEKAYYRKRFLWNLLQLLVGTVLLIVAYFHLQRSTAEKMSISSWVDVISQKVQLRFHSLFNKDGNTYLEKINMEKNYHEVLNVVQNSSCKDKVDGASLSKMNEQLKNDTVEEYAKKSAEYNKFLVDFYTNITKVCGEEVHTQQ